LGRRILYENPAALFFEKRTSPPPELMPFVPLAV
jgi:hypothetical protein